MNESPYRRLLASNLIGVIIAGTDGRIEDANDRFLGMVGYTREELESGRVPWDAMTPPEWSDVDLRAIQELESTGVCSPFEKEYLHKDGHRVPIRATVVILDGKSGDGICLIEDLTGRKQAEAALRESEERHRFLVETTHDLVQSVDANGFFTFVNRAWCETLGWTMEEATRMNFCDVLHPDEVRHCLELFEMLKKGDQFDRMEVRFVSRDGRQVVLEGNLTARFQNGRFAGIQSFFTDISERKRAEVALQEVHDRLVKTVATAPGVVCSFRLRPDGSACYPYGGERLSEVYGIPPGRLAEDAEPFLSLIHADDLGGLRESIAESAQTLSPFRYEYRVRHPVRGELWIETHSMPLREPDGSTLWHGIATDITERKRAEEELSETGRRLQIVLDGTQTGLWDWEIGTSRVHYSREWKKLLGYEEDEVADDFDEWRRLTHPDDVGPTLTRVAAFLEQPHGAWDFEFRMFHKSGELRWILSRATALLDASGKPVRLLGTHLDITERKRAEEQLREREKFLESITESMPDIIYLYNAQHRQHLYINRELATLLGFSSEEIRHRGADVLLNAIHPQDLPRVMHHIETMANSAVDDGVHHLEYRIEGKDGGYLWFYVREQVYQRDQAGRPEILFGMCQDITQRKATEEALRTSGEQFRELTETIQDVFWSRSAESWQISYVSPAYERLWGRSKANLLANPGEWIEAIEPEDRIHVLEALEGLAGGGLYDVEYRIRRPDGSGLWIHDRGFAVRDTDGVICRIVGAASDITARRLAEQAIEHANERLQTLSRRLLEIQELERRRIARELHDEIGQVLTATKINLESLQRYPERGSMIERLSESVGIIDHALGQVRSLSLELRPPLLDDFGLASALRWLTDQHAHRTGLQMEVRSSAGDARFGSTVETACFRVAQEALNNVVRHAGAHRVAMDLKVQDDRLHLHVSDDGTGFDALGARLRAAQGASLGLLGMEERATLTGGGIEWHSSAGKGTDVHAWFPLPRPTDN